MYTSRFYFHDERLHFQSDIFQLKNNKILRSLSNRPNKIASKYGKKKTTYKHHTD